MTQDQMINDIGDSQILHPGSRQLFRQWEMLRAERPCPTREDFDFRTIKTVLADMLVIDRDYLRNSFRFRLAGTRVCDFFKQNLTGTNVLAGWDSFEADVLSRHMLTVLNQLQPAVVRMRMTTDRGQVVAAEMLLLPVRMRDSHRVQIMGGLFPFRAAQSLGHGALTARELASARVIWTEHVNTQANDVRPPVLQPVYTGKPQFTLIAGGLAESA